MSLLDEYSCDCLKSELDLFEVPPTNTSIGDCKFIQFYPITSTTIGGPIEFVIKTSNDVYLDLSSTLLYTKSRILLRGGSEITESLTTDNRYVAPINYWGCTQFKDIQVYINGRLVSNNDNLSAYRSYLETLLTYSEQSKNDQLACSLFYKDNGDNLDWIDENIADPEKTKNDGLTIRYEKTKNSKTFETFGRIHSEMFTQNKLFPGGNEIRIKNFRTNPDFSLISKTKTADSFQISTDTAILYIRQCEIPDYILESHKKAIQTRNMKFPVRRGMLKFFSKSSGRSDLSEPNLVSGTLPTKLIIGLVDSEAFNDNINKNPFNFQNFNLQSIVLRKNGTAMPFEELCFDYNNDIYTQGYMSLIIATSKLFQDQGFNITPEEYKNGYTLYGFDLTSDITPGNSINLLQQGKLSLELKLKEVCSSSITIIVYLEFESIVELNAQGEVFINE